MSEQRQLRVDLCRLNYPMTRDTLVYGDKRNRQLLAEAKKKIEDKTSASKNTVENNESANKNVLLF